MSSVKNLTPQTPLADMVDSLKNSASENPIIKRLRAKLTEGLSTGALISRYDRMHHRHNRS